MTKQLTNLEMFNYISNISESLMHKATGKVAYALSYNIRQIQSELVEYLEIRAQIINKYSEDLGDGQFGISVKSEKYNQFLDEMKDYDNIRKDIKKLEDKRKSIDNKIFTFSKNRFIFLKTINYFYKIRFFIFFLPSSRAFSIASS